MGLFDWASSVTYVLTDWTFLTILYSTGIGNEALVHSVTALVTLVQQLSRDLSASLIKAIVRRNIDQISL